MLHNHAVLQQRVGPELRWRGTTVVWSLWLVVALAGLAQAQTITWAPIDLGTLGGTSADTSTANGINNRGDVVGSSTINGETRAFLWTAADGMRDLGTLGGPSSTARSINDARQVVGASDVWPDVHHAFVWTDAGGMVDLGTLGGATSEAFAINNLGQVVGTSLVATGERHPFLWTEATGMTDLASALGDTAAPRGINDAGQIVGNSSAFPAFSWTPSGGLVRLPRAITALGVNNAGAVTGSFSHPQWLYWWTYIWTAADGIRAVGGEADGIDINDAGEIVANPYEGPPAGFVYAATGFFVLPVLPGAPQFSPSPRFGSAISNAGVAGYASTLPLGRFHAVFWCKPGPPTITGASVTPAVLSPPDGRLVQVHVGYDVTTACLRTFSASLSVSSDEALDPSDVVVVDEHTVQLRAARTDGGDGRTYTIQIRAVDTEGLEATHTVTVTVPLESGPMSADGTTVPPATQIVDASGAIWTIGGNRAILRNGVHAAGGWGSQIVWTSHTLYVLGPDNNWYQWTGSSWTFLGPTFPGASPEGTTVPDATQIVDDDGATWTIGPDRAILRNGFHAAGGWGSQIVWTSHTLYVLGPDDNWYQWTGSSWTFLGPTFPGASRDGTTVPHATQIVDTSGAIWTIGGNRAILRNGVHAAGGWGSQIVWSSHTLYVLGPDNNWYQWTGSSWTFLGPTFLGASPEGTTVPDATQIVDDDGATWTIGPNRAILRNGVHAAGGWGSQIFWSSHTLYVLGPDDNWYQWTGSSWTFLGPTFPGASPDGTTVPHATQIVDASGAIWTIGGNRAILRNGVHAAGGWGSQIVWTSHTLYVLGPDTNWYQWTGSSWTFLGPTFPGASPDGTTVLHATQIVDDDGAIWTIGGNRAILRNGVHAAGGWGSQIVWTSHTLYVLGPDTNWYQWTGSSWTFLGPTFPGASPDGTTVPDATQIVDTNGAIWTIGPNGAILRNGVHAAGGWGQQIVWASHTLYVLGPDNNWYQWTGFSWTFIGATFPGGAVN